MSNQAAIRKILGYKSEVQVRDQLVVLSVPTPEAVAEMTDLIGKVLHQRAGGLDDNSGLAETYKFSRELSILAIAATVKCNNEEAEMLFVVAGGETSDLAVKAKEMCGLSPADLDDDDGGGADNFT